MGRPQLPPDTVAFEAALGELIDEISAVEIGDPAQCAVFSTLDLGGTRQEFTVKPRTSKRGSDSRRARSSVAPAPKAARFGDRDGVLQLTERERVKRIGAG
jgi:hypothetical protein